MDKSVLVAIILGVVIAAWTVSKTWGNKRK